MPFSRGVTHSTRMNLYASVNPIKALLIHFFLFLLAIEQHIQLKVLKCTSINDTLYEAWVESGYSLVLMGGGMGQHCNLSWSRGFQQRPDQQ